MLSVSPPQPSHCSDLFWCPVASRVCVLLQPCPVKYRLFKEVSNIIWPLYCNYKLLLLEVAHRKSCPQSLAESVFQCEWHLSLLSCRSPCIGLTQSRSCLSCPICCHTRQLYLRDIRSYVLFRIQCCLTDFIQSVQWVAMCDESSL